MSKSQLEKVLEHLINEDVEAAEALFHDFILGKARQIHKELMEEADGLEESSLGEDEEYFGGDELEGGEEGSEGGEGEEAVAGGEEGGEEAVADIEGELGDEEGGEKSVEDLEAEVQDLQADLADLKAQFEQLMDVEGDEHGDELNGSEEEAGEVDGGEGDISEPLTGEGEGSEDETEESFNFNEFEDLDESFELEPVKVDVKAGTEIGTGSKIAQNNESPIPQKKVGDRAFKGKPVEIKAEEHKGYDREPSPTVKDRPLLKNQVKNAQANLEKVSKEGDKAALINKTEAEFGGPNDKSPIGSKGSRTGA